MPATATAVFGPGHPASRTDLRGASVSYLNARQVPVLEVGEYQGGFRDRVDGLMVCVERG